MRIPCTSVVVACLLGTSVRRADAYSDDKLGYSIQVPGGLRAIPIAADEQYVVAKWQSEREYVSKKEGYSLRYEMKVVLFEPHAKAEVKVEKLESGVNLLTRDNPYKNFRDWVKSDSQGGRYISKEEEITVGGLPTTWFEVAYEKLTVPRHGVAFVYHASDVDYCVMAEVLEEKWKDLSPSLLSAFRTFKTFPRKGSLEKDVTTGDSPIGDVLSSDISKQTPQERLAKRTEQFEKKVRLATERLTAGWVVKRSKNYVAISHCDAKFTQMVLDHAEGIRAWADANLAYFGEGLPGPEMIRIAKDYDEERAISDVSSRSGGFGWSQELICSRSDGLWGFREVGRRVFDRWTKDKNSRLSSSLPAWLEDGLDTLVASALVRGGKLEFPDGSALAGAKFMAKQGSLLPLQDLVQATREDMHEKSKGVSTGPDLGGFTVMNGAASAECAAFVRYLLSGRGPAVAKDLLRAYLANLETRIKSEAGKPGVEVKSATTEEEEEQQFKNRKDTWGEREKETLKAVYDATFTSWKDSDWTAVEKAFKAFVSQ